MPINQGFMDRLIDRLDRIDPRSLQTHFLRLARERGLLEMIFQSIQEGVLVVEGDGRLAYANRAAEQYLGFSIDAAAGKPVARILPDIDWDRVLELDADEWSRLMVREIEIAQPSYRVLAFYVAPMARNETDERGVVVMLRDVTRDREQEATLLESERLNAVKLLAAGVAHEIGNPLNALTIHLQLLDREIRDLIDGAAPGERRDVLAELQSLTEVARNEVTRLDLIITQFLRAIRPTRPQLAAASIEDVITETLTLLKQDVQDRSIEVDIDRPRGIPRIRVDRDQIKQAVFNIIRNAFQAMPDGGRLSIALFANAEHVGVAFEDTGAGIAQGEMGRIFEPYHTTKPSGAGLGLMIVQRIVQDHGGQIEVTSKEGIGTRFTILLPRVPHGPRLLEARPAHAAEPVPVATPADETVNADVIEPEGAAHER